MKSRLTGMDIVNVATEIVHTENEVGTMGVDGVGMDGTTVDTDGMDVDMDLERDLVDMAANTGDDLSAIEGFQSFFRFQLWFIDSLSISHVSLQADIAFVSRSSIFLCSRLCRLKK